MLEVRNLTVSYGPVKAVDGLDLTIGEGEAVALLGPNGAGKTSTLRAISGLVKAGGEVRFDGLDLRKATPEAIAQRGLLHVPEGRRVFPTLTVHENLLVGVTARHGRTPAYDIDEIYDLFTPLIALRDREGWALSGGEQQMVAIGRALVGAPRLLLLDEPSLGLAPVVVKVVYEALREVVKATPLLVVEQNTPVALALCHRGVVLAGGRPVLSGTSAELDDQRLLLDAYLGQTVLDETG